MSSNAGTLAHAAEIVRERDDTFGAIVSACLGDIPATGRGPGARLDAALTAISEDIDWANHPSIKYHDRPEDMEPEAAEAPELARRA